MNGRNGWELRVQDWQQQGTERSPVSAEEMVGFIKRPWDKVHSSSISKSFERAGIIQPKERANAMNEEEKEDEETREMKQEEEEFIDGFSVLRLV